MSRRAWVVPALAVLLVAAAVALVYQSHRARSVMTDDYLTAVACPSRAQCWAVGQTAAVPGGDVAAQTRAPLAEREQGGRWQVVSTPLVRGGNEALESIACPAADQCWAVGGSSATGPAIIERWTGDRWRLAPSPAVHDGELTSISCVSVADCWAVGAAQTPGGAHGPVVEHWDGTRWHWRPAPAGRLSPAAITCPAAGHCWLVGTGAGGAARLVHGRWVLVALPGSTPTGNTLTGFASVACTAGGSACWAVAGTPRLVAPGEGSFGSNVVDLWNGRAWRPAARLPAHTLARATACTARACWLLGSAGQSATRPLALRWADGRWIAAPVGTAGRSNYFTALACAAACWGVGGTGALVVSPPSYPLAERVPAAG